MTTLRRRTSDEGKAQPRWPEGASVVFDHRGVILSWPVPLGTTVNDDNHQWILRKKMRPALRRRRSDLAEGVVLLQDSAKPLLKACVVEMVVRWE